MLAGVLLLIAIMIGLFAGWVGLRTYDAHGFNLAAPEALIVTYAVPASILFCGILLFAIAEAVGLLREISNKLDRKPAAA